MTNLIFTHDDCRYHGDKRPREAADDTPPPGGYTHPEQPPRLRAVLDGLSASPALAAIERKDAAEADPARLKTLHGSAYVDAMLRPVAEAKSTGSTPIPRARRGRPARPCSPLAAR